MFNQESIKKIMDSFHSMKGHLNSLEKDYSQLLEKSESLSHQSEEPNPTN
mgnify:CR=1 FL=1